MGLWKVLKKRFYGLGNRGIGVLDLKMYGFGELWGKLGIIFFCGRFDMEYFGNGKECIAKIV